MDTKDNTPMEMVLGIVTDLMFVVRIGDAVRRAGRKPMFVGSLERARVQAAERPVLVIVDLACTAADPIQVIQEVKELGIPVIAFGAHVDTEALQAAKKAGADRVLPRSRFVEELEKLVAE
jgi:DNA-binding NarL/FixJ family response regulator